MNTAQDIIDVISRYADFVTGVSPFEPAVEDTTEDLLALHTLLKGFSAPKDQIPDRGVIGLLSDLCVDVDAELHKRLTKDKAQLGDYEVERTYASYNETWDHARCVEEIAIHALVDENGQIPDSPVEAANTVANAIVSSAGIRYWKVKTGDKFGVDLRKFRDRGTQTSPAGVIVRRAQVQRADPGIPEKKGTPSPDA